MRAEQEASKATQKIEQTIEGLRIENLLLRENAGERDKLRKILEAEAVARRGGIQLTEEQRSQIEDLVVANENLVRAQADYQRHLDYLSNVGERTFDGSEAQSLPWRLKVRMPGRAWEISAWPCCPILHRKCFVWQQSIR